MSSNEPSDRTVFVMFALSAVGLGSITYWATTTVVPWLWWAATTLWEAS